MNQVQPTLLIADDHNMLTKLFKNYFGGKGYNVVGTAENGKQVVNLLTKYPVDLVLMDYGMPEMDGIEATNYISKNYPDTKVLMLSMFTKPIYIEEAFSAGAKGYMSKESEPEEIETALKEILNENMYLSPGIATNYIAYTKAKEQGKTIKITPVENKILQAINLGETTKQVSKKLELSEYTIGNYLKNLRVKFGVNNITGLLAAAREIGYIK